MDVITAIGAKEHDFDQFAANWVLGVMHTEYGSQILLGAIIIISIVLYTIWSRFDTPAEQHHSGNSDYW